MSYLIFSEKTDFSVNRVVDWLEYYGHSYEKYIGATENPDLFEFQDKTFSFSFGGKGGSSVTAINSEEQPLEIQSTWFRRPNQAATPFLKDYPYEGAYPKEKLNQTIYHRFRIFWDFVGYKLSEQSHFGSFKTTELNKPIVMEEAIKLGMTVPKTLITNSKKDLEQFFEDCDRKIITKSLHEVIKDHRYEFKEDEYVFIYQMTQLLEALDERTPDVFAPSLFQECIEKEYEIRTIYMNGQCYSAAIFSQLNEQTKVDMRNRDANTPTRYMPYQLPEALEQKIDALMQKLKLRNNFV